MSAMDRCDCVEILRVYRRARWLGKPVGRNRWLASTMANVSDQVVRMAPGSCDISQDGDDLVSILIAVPCDDKAAIEPPVLLEYENIADVEFQQFCGGAIVIEPE